eukprot:Seg3578.2 transcript_id=Seg3578.2/GoldUCD/mRNA.D3Y31 product="hypothetical protein" protein_id=Seg3578.2/GoldUCD/D3Y31
MIFNEDGTTELVVYQFKTNHQYGANRIKVSNYDFVDSHVKAFIKKERKKLLQGTSHDFLFMKSNGEPFDSTGGFCKYMQATFKKYNGGNSLYSTTNLRKTLVTRLTTSEKSAEVRESVARLMSHTPRMQHFRYDAMESIHKIKQGADHITAKTRESLGMRAERLKDDIQLPFCDEIVACVPSNSTYANPTVNLGKVLGLRNDMASLTQAGDPNHFNFDVGTILEEDIEAIIRPIDTAYLPGDYVYVLRTSKREIHQYLQSSSRCADQEEEEIEGN